ncbi:MAG: alpha/beta fold hydrolase [Patescibacteria group bacterium]
MKKVFLIHGFEGSPNGGWRPWLMAELENRDIYACSLSMPDPENPRCTEWVEEIARHVRRNSKDEIYLVGHSLGVPAMLRYLESANASIKGAVLVSGPALKTGNEIIDDFFRTPFDFENIRSKAEKFRVIHGDNDPRVDIKEAEILSKELNAPLAIIPNGGHLNGSSGWRSLPECLNALLAMMG